MSRPKVKIDGKGPMELAVIGFISEKCAHEHLFKHVLCITFAHTSKTSESEMDKENWSELIGNPPLISSLPARREDALKKLSPVIGCELIKNRQTMVRPCSLCTDRKSQKMVNQAFNDLLRAYEKCAGVAFDDALADSSRSRPRVLAFENGAASRGIRIRTLDSKLITVIGQLDINTGRVSLVSCYRQEWPHPKGSEWLDIMREMDGHRREKTLVNVEKT